MRFSGLWKYDQIFPAFSSTENTEIDTVKTMKYPTLKDLLNEEPPERNPMVADCDWVVPEKILRFHDRPADMKVGDIVTLTGTTRHRYYVVEILDAEDILVLKEPDPMQEDGHEGERSPWTILAGIILGLLIVKWLFF